MTDKPESNPSEQPEDDQNRSPGDPIQPESTDEPDPTPTEETPPPREVYAIYHGAESASQAAETTEEAGTSPPADDPPPSDPPTDDRSSADQIVPIVTSVVLTLIVLLIFGLLSGYTALPNELATLREENNQMQTEVAELQEVSMSLGESEALVATIQAEVGANQGVLSAFATTQAEQGTEIEDLSERTERINGFLELLSEIAGDATVPGASAPDSDADLEGDAAETPTEEATPAQTMEPSSTAVIVVPPEVVPEEEEEEATTAPADETPTPTSTPTPTPDSDE